MLGWINLDVALAMSPATDVMCVEAGKLPLVSLLEHSHSLAVPVSWNDEQRLPLFVPV